MKRKLFSLMSGLLLTAALSAQFNSGSVYFTGMTNFHFGFESEEGYNYFLLGLNTEGGYFLQNRLALGGSVFTEAQLGLNDFAESSLDIFLGPSARYYLARDEEPQIYLYGMAGYGIERSGYDMYYTTHQKLGFIVGPGCNYFLNEHIALDARLTYMYQYLWNAAGGGHHSRHRLFFEAGISIFFPTLTFYRKPE
ncbi:MAG: outer membrane beta-barrel protein [Bacteroidota bacterium]